jgi:ABC-type uncharacterized transport system YnjBCD substrate-binding protein
MNNSRSSHDSFSLGRIAVLAVSAALGYVLAYFPLMFVYFGKDTTSSILWIVPLSISASLTAAMFVDLLLAEDAQVVRNPAMDEVGADVLPDAQQSSATDAGRTAPPGSS